MSKYNKLWEYIKEQNKNELTLSYEKIKDILGFNIDHSFLNYKKELENYNYKVEKISLKNKEVLFRKI